MEKIETDFERLNLHDSHFEKIEFSGNDMYVYVDWAKLLNYNEKNISGEIVLGKTKITVIGYSNEQIEINFDGSIGHEKKEKIITSYSEDILENWNVIIQNEIESNTKQSVISGLYYSTENILCWIDWKFIFKEMIIEWDNYILHEDWMKGKMAE